jgi:hypothetical protein
MTTVGSDSWTDLELWGRVRVGRMDVMGEEPSLELVLVPALIFCVGVRTRSRDGTRVRKIAGLGVGRLTGLVVPEPRSVDGGGGENGDEEHRRSHGEVVNGVRGREEETVKGPRRVQDAFQLKLRVPDVIYVMLPPHTSFNIPFRSTAMSSIAAYNLPVDDGSTKIQHSRPPPCLNVHSLRGTNAKILLGTYPNTLLRRTYQHTLSSDALRTYGLLWNVSTT